MKTAFITFVIVFPFVSSVCLPQSGEADKKTANAVCPQADCVPDQQTAVRIAEAVLIPVYGEKHTKSEEPFTARLNGTRWIVKGTLGKARHKDEIVVGGTAMVEIDKKDGRILAVYHLK